MKHQPLFEVFGIAVLFLLLCLPAYRLSTKTPDVVHEHHGHGKHEHDEEETCEHVSTWISFKFAHSPTRVEMKQDGKTIWTHNPQGEKLCEEELHLIIEDNRIEVLLHIEWPKNINETIVELTLEPDELESQSQREWGQGQIASRMVFDWNAP